MYGMVKKSGEKNLKGQKEGIEKSTRNKEEIRNIRKHKEEETTKEEIRKETPEEKIRAVKKRGKRESELRVTSSSRDRMSGGHL